MKELVNRDSSTFSSVINNLHLSYDFPEYSRNFEKIQERIISVYVKIKYTHIKYRGKDTHTHIACILQ